MLVDRRTGRRALIVVTVLVVVCAGLAFAWRFWRMADDATTAMARGQYHRALVLYRQSALGGDVVAQTATGNLHYLGMGTERDYGAARDWYYRAAAKEESAAMVNLGHLYREGLGVDQDVMRAFAWYRIAERHGSGIAEVYQSMIASEWSLSPLMMSTAKERWPRLEDLLQARRHERQTPPEG